MKTPRAILIIFIIISLCIIFFGINKLEILNEKQESKFDVEILKTKLFFEPNYGQFRSDINFVSQGNGYSLFLSKDKATLALNNLDNNNNDLSFIQMELVGMQEPRNVSGRNKMLSKSNYFYGNDKDEWLTNIPNYEQVVYEKVYPGIDLVYYGKSGILEYDFIISPEGSPTDILLDFQSEKKFKIDKHGNIVFKDGGNKVFIKAPIAYQEINNEQKFIDAEFVKLGNSSVGFKLGKYDEDLSLIIDPQIVFSTILGNNSGAVDIALDNEENIYITGLSGYWDYSTGLLPGSSTRNVFVVKMNSAGNEILYSSFFGGSYEDYPWCIDVDHEGNVLVAGRTLSDDFPLANALQTEFRGEKWVDDGDAFVAKINPEGDDFIYSTYLGGSYNDCAYDITVDKMGNAFVTGEHWPDDDFPYKNQLDMFDLIDDDFYENAFIAKISPAGLLEFASCLAGANTSVGYGITTDTNNDVYITGSATQGFSTTTGAYLTEGYGTYVVKIDNIGSKVFYSTYICGAENYGLDQGRAIAVDELGNAYVVGATWHEDFPTINAFQNSFSHSGINSYGWDGFISKLSPSGAYLIFSSFIGGDGTNDICFGVDIGANNDIYVIGRTNSTNFPLIEPFQNSLNGRNDAFIAKINGETYALDFSSYYGGSGAELEVGSNIYTNAGISASDKGYVYIAGQNGSADFPLENGFSEITGTYGSFIVKFVDEIVNKGILTANPDNIVFPLVMAGQSVKKTIELYNSGQSPVEVYELNIDQPDVYSLVDTPTLPFKLEPEQSKEINLVYSPEASNISTKEGFLEIKSDAETPITLVYMQPVLTINDTSDLPDNPLDNICDVDLSKEGYQVTLRAAIEFVNEMKSEETTDVIFDIPIDRPQIYLKSGLPSINYPISLNASKQQGGIVLLDGKYTAESDGLVINGGNSTIVSMNIQSFKNGIILNKNDSNLIDDCVILDNTKNGIYIGSNNNIISNCTVIDNWGGILIVENAEKNSINLCNIGIDFNGTQARSNTIGIRIVNASGTEIINNIISGNTESGIHVFNGVNSNYEHNYAKIFNNSIGIAKDGITPIANGNGIDIYETNRGLDVSIKGNVISGNFSNGIRINGARNGSIINNFIGIDAQEKNAVPNGANGIFLSKCSRINVEDNIIAANQKNGIYCWGLKNPFKNIIQYNYIGYNRDGYNFENKFKNGESGIYISDESPYIRNNHIGGHSGDAEHYGIYINSNYKGHIGKNDIHNNDIGIKIVNDQYSKRISTNSNSISYSCYVFKNKIYYNRTGVILEGQNTGTLTVPYIKTNEIYGNYGNSTGLHIINSPAIVEGNNFYNDHGNAITVEGNSNVSISQNNIIDNQGFGLENRNPSNIINAENNYWGHSSGPGGFGPGSGDLISEGVNYSNWYKDTVTVYASVGGDTIYAPIGKTDSTLLFIDNIKAGTNDIIDVAVTDSLGWVHGFYLFAIESIPDSINDNYLVFSIPPETTEGTCNTIKLEAYSNIDHSDIDSTIFTIIATNQYTEYLTLDPDTIEIARDASYQFVATGYDQFYSVYNTTFNWSCTGGTIDDEGFFTAGNEDGDFYVIVEEPTSSLSDTAVVIISEETQVSVKNIKTEISKQLLHNYPNPFSNSTTINYTLENPGYVTLRVYNSIGQEVVELVDSYLPSGTYEVVWQPVGLTNGVYFNRMEISGSKNNTTVYSEVQKIVFMKLE